MFSYMVAFVLQISLFVTSVQINGNPNTQEIPSETPSNHSSRRSMLLSGTEPISSIPTGAVLPGISYFNKIYNMLDGTDLLEKPGRDLFTFRYSNMIQTWTSQYTYLVPVEFTGVPNLYPQCTKDTSLTVMKEIWSSTIITDESYSQSSGFYITLPQIASILAPIINMAYPGVGSTISSIATSEPFKDISASIQNGNSRNTKTSRMKRKDGYTRAYELRAEASLYEAGLAWDVLNHFSLKTDFQQAINNLELSATNEDILMFIYLWGTHVIKRARMGAMCQESVYIKSLVSGNDYNDFYTYTQQTKSGILFWKKESSSTTTMTQSGTYNNEIFYEFANVRCEGECYTTQPCGGMTGQGFWVKPVEYELIPIWSIGGLLSTPLSDKLQLFITNIINALLFCRIYHCSNHGICTLRDDLFTLQYVSSWDGVAFSDMIDYNRACYCDNGYIGDLCTSPSTIPSQPPTPAFAPTGTTGLSKAEYIENLKNRLIG